MSSDLTVRNSPLPERMRYAEALAGSNLIPDAFKRNPHNVLVAIEYGNALGLAPIVALTEVNVIKGTPALSAAMMAALARDAGHKVRTRGDDKQATCQIMRADDPDYTHEATWTEQKARDAGLWGRGHWAKDPATMLKWRAISEAVRFACPEVLGGLKYTPEEVAEFKSRPAATAHDDIQDAEVDPEPGPEPEPISDHTRRHVFALLNERGVTDADQQRAGMSKVLGREITSRTELTEDDGRRLIASLETLPVPEPVEAELEIEEVADDAPDA